MGIQGSITTNRPLIQCLVNGHWREISSANPATNEDAVEICIDRNKSHGYTYRVLDHGREIFMIGEDRP